MGTQTQKKQAAGLPRRENAEIERLRRELEASRRQLAEAQRAAAAAPAAAAAAGTAAAPAPTAAEGEGEGGEGGLPLLNLVGIFAAGGLAGYLALFRRTVAEGEAEAAARLEVGDALFFFLHLFHLYFFTFLPSCCFLFYFFSSFLLFSILLRIFLQ